jgi:transcriptional regulator with XRE-family HTH domain
MLNKAWITLSNAIKSMARKNILTTVPPFEVEQALKRLGANLRTARLRRNLTLELVANKIGTGVRAIRDAEAGRPGASVAVYTALLWAYDLLRPLAEIADPARDEEGLALERQRKHAYPKKALDNDF